MPEYTVTARMSSEADSPVEAARNFLADVVTVAGDSELLVVVRLDDGSGEAHRYKLSCAMSPLDLPEVFVWITDE